MHFVRTDRHQAYLSCPSKSSQHQTCGVSDGETGSVGIDPYV